MAYEAAASRMWRMAAREAEPSVARRCLRLSVVTAPVDPGLHWRSA